MKKLLVIALIAVTAVSFTACGKKDNKDPGTAKPNVEQPAKLKDTTYKNERFEYELTFPETFKHKETSQNGDGATYSDGVATIVTYGAYNIMEENIQEIDTKMSAIRSRGDYLYTEVKKEVKDDNLILEEENDADYMVTKQIVNKEMVAGVSFRYPKDKAKEYKDLAQKVVGSLKLPEIKEVKPDEKPEDKPEVKPEEKPGDTKPGDNNAGENNTALYENGRFNFSFQYPKTFTSKNVSANGDGVQITDGNANIIAFASFNSLEDTVKSYADANKDEVIFRQVDIKFSGDSYIKKEESETQVKYSKVIVNSEKICNVSFVYDKNMASKYEQMAYKAISTLK